MANKTMTVPQGDFCSKCVNRDLELPLCERCLLRTGSPVVVIVPTEKPKKRTVKKHGNK